VIHESQLRTLAGSWEIEASHEQDERLRALARRHAKELRECLADTDPQQLVPIERGPLSGVTVLVVDDEIADATGRHINALGGAVIKAASVAAARELLARAAASSIRIHCGVIDLLLHNGNGSDLIREQQLIQPGFASVLISGVDLETITLERVRGVFLPKPFTRDALLAAVQQALEQVK
jgi:hypothetical protein